MTTSSNSKQEVYIKAWGGVYPQKDFNRYCWHYKRLRKLVENFDVVRFEEALKKALKNGYPIDFGPDQHDQHYGDYPLMFIALQPLSNAA